MTGMSEPARSDPPGRSAALRRPAMRVPSTPAMNRISSTITLCAVVGCSPGSAPQGQAQQVPPTKPAEPPASPPPVVAKDWQLRLTTQFLGVVPGPLQVVSVDASGALKVEVDGKIVGQTMLNASDVAPLARLLAAPELAAARSTPEGPGPQAHLVVTGDVKLDLAGEVPALTPVLVEVDRLRDLVAPPENFKIYAVDGDGEVLVSANGYVEVKRGGAVVAKHNIPVEALAKVRGILSMDAIRRPESWAAPTGAATLRIDGDIEVSGAVDLLVMGAASSLIAEAKRLGAAVEAKNTRPTNFEAVFTQQLHGAGLGPLRKITVRSSDRHIVLVDEEPGVQPSDRPLKDEEWTALLEMLVDPGFRLAEGKPPSGEGVVYKVKITGDAPMDATFRGDPPPSLVNLLNRLDWLARHY